MSNTFLILDHHFLNFLNQKFSIKIFALDQMNSSEKRKNILFVPIYQTDVKCDSSVAYHLSYWTIEGFSRFELSACQCSIKLNIMSPFIIRSVKYVCQSGKKWIKLMQNLFQMGISNTKCHILLVDKHYHFISQYSKQLISQWLIWLTVALSIL